MRGRYNPSLRFVDKGLCYCSRYQTETTQADKQKLNTVVQQFQKPYNSDLIQGLWKRVLHSNITCMSLRLPGAPLHDPDPDQQQEYRERVG